MHSGPAKSTPSGWKGELSLVALIRGRAVRQSLSGKRNPWLRLGIGDDCALLRLRAGEELALTTDLSIAGRHFRLDWHPPEAIGHRTLARGLSDLAAMGARPVAAFLSLGLPRKLTGDWLRRYLDGFFALAEAHKIALAGGDLAESPIAVADIVLAGTVGRGKALLRSGAKPGDLLYVTGELGAAAAGLEQLKQLAGRRTKSRPSRKTESQPVPLQPLRIPARLAPSLAPHLYPQPRVSQGLWLVRSSIPTAAIDLSDGLSTDLAHLLEESGVAAEIDTAALPTHPAATLSQALHGGEDYDLLFTAAPSTPVPRRIAGVPVTRIGRILRAQAGTPRIALVTAHGSHALKPRGWEHFSQP
jgi:thiamine-monophosphate kinase